MKNIDFIKMDAGEVVGKLPAFDNGTKSKPEGKYIDLTKLRIIADRIKVPLPALLKCILQH